ncbi:MAG TPA: acetyl-CoA hydrolase [Nitrospiraceae bacterium]|jgi:acyl-CoA hydrolase/GNAT superfamily N-acetyltransferase|nr:acetyl-CoA hydrolase [Nitrospiraceae bacterium]
MDDLTTLYPEKCIAEEKIFSNINPGNRIFIGTGCGEPSYLVGAFINYVRSHPKAFFDAELLQVWTLGVTPYANEKFKDNFRHNSFFIGNNTREAVNKGLADYTPIFLSAVPKLFYRRIIPIDVALVQTSLPDAHGYMSLGISVDIVKAAVETASLVIAQVNRRMPRVHGETFIHVRNVDFIVPYDEPLLEFRPTMSGDITAKIGKYVSRLIQDTDTIQVGYGTIPDAVLSQLSNKRHLGIHTELLSDGVIELMKMGVVDNSYKEINRGKTVAAFCMGKQETYEYLHDNPAIEFRPVSYTNNPLVIARQRNMTAINSALEIDLTGEATAESLGKLFYSGIGGQADFMRGAVLSQGGKTILALQSTAENDEVSRIVPYLREGAGVTLTRGDVHYVVTEYGIAYLHGKNIRERAMDLISIAHPKFQPWLIDEAKKLNMIYKDQAFISGEKGAYPESLETRRVTKTGLKLFLRPVKISDEQFLKDFFYSLSDQSMYHRFMSRRRDMPHERLQKFVIIDYTKEMVILAVTEEEGKEVVVGLGQYIIDDVAHTAEAAFVVRDIYQNMGIGSELLSYLTYLAKRSGLHGFTAEVLVENLSMLHVFESMGFVLEKRPEGGVYELKMSFEE